MQERNEDANSLLNSRLPLNPYKLDSCFTVLLAIRHCFRRSLDRNRLAKLADVSPLTWYTANVIRGTIRSFAVALIFQVVPNLSDI